MRAPQGELSRQQQKAATRKALLEAARVCFGERGFDATTIGHIAGKAGVAPGTIYVHFSAKEALADELLDQFNQEIAETLEPVLQDINQEPLRTTVKRVADAFFDLWEREADFVRVYVERSKQGVGNSALAGGVNPQMTRALGQILAGSKKTICGPISWELVVHGVLAMWLRIGLQYLFVDSVKRDDAIATLVEMTVGALSPLLEIDNE